MDHDSQLGNKLYRNWVRSSLGLKYLQQGLEPFVDEQAQLQHSSFLKLVPSTALVTHIHCSKCTDCRIEHNNGNCNIRPIVHVVSASHRFCQTCSVGCCTICNVKFCNQCNQISAGDVIKCRKCNFVSCIKCKLSYCTNCSKRGEDNVKCANYKHDHCVDIKSVHSVKCDMTSCSDCAEEYCKYCMKLANKQCLCSIKTLYKTGHTKSCPSKVKQPCNCYGKFSCVKNGCGILYDTIITSHTLNDPIWSNTNPVHWTSSYWEVAKCFLSGSGYTYIQTATDTDASGLLSICINNVFIGRNIAGIYNFKEARSCRNKILHSSSFEVDDVDTIDYIDQMIAVLEDTKMLIKEASAINAVRNLNKLKNDEIEITSKDISEMRKNALDAVERFLAEKEIDIQKLKDECEQLSEAGIKHRKDIRNLVEDNQELHAELNKTKKAIADVDTRAKEYADDVELRAIGEIRRLEKGIGSIVIDKLKELRIDPSANQTETTAKVVIQPRDGTVTAKKDDEICQAVVEVSNDEVNGQPSRDMLCGLRERVSSVFGFLKNGFKPVEQASKECVILQIRCQTLHALITLFEDCMSGQMTTLFVPVQEELRTWHGCQNLELEVFMYQNDFWSSVACVERSLKATCRQERESVDVEETRTRHDTVLFEDMSHPWPGYFEITVQTLTKDASVVKDSLRNMLDDIANKLRERRPDWSIDIGISQRPINTDTIQGLFLHFINVENENIWMDFDVTKYCVYDMHDYTRISYVF